MTPTHLIAVIVATVACAIDLRDQTHSELPDVFRRRAGDGRRGVDGWPEGAMTSSAGWIAGLAIFFVPFALRGLGGGDVKLLAALGAWVGPTDVIWVALYTGIVGGLLALS